jgi:hypothetical protein
LFQQGDALGRKADGRVASLFRQMDVVPGVAVQPGRSEPVREGTGSVGVQAHQRGVEDEGRSVGSSVDDMGRTRRERGNVGLQAWRMVCG